VKGTDALCAFVGILIKRRKFLTLPCSNERLSKGCDINASKQK
jgi:hypothetical protein